MRKMLCAIAVVYGLIGVVYVTDDGRSARQQPVATGDRTWAGRCPALELAPTCSGPDMYPTVVN
jgi:hypothetical protein